MSSVATPVTAVPAFTLVNGASPQPQTVRIYTLSSGVAERVESVAMTVDYVGNPSQDSILVIQFVDQSGLILFESASPPITSDDSDPIEVHGVWSRLGNDSAQEAVATVVSADESVHRCWFNVRLPELVLEADSVVNLLHYSDFFDEGGDAVVPDATITVTRNVGGVSSTSPVDVTPYLLPAFNS